MTNIEDHAVRMDGIEKVKGRGEICHEPSSTLNPYHLSHASTGSGGLWFGDRFGDRFGARIVILCPPPHPVVDSFCQRAPRHCCRSSSRRRSWCSSSLGWWCCGFRVTSIGCPWPNSPFLAPRPLWWWAGWVRQLGVIRYQAGQWTVLSFPYNR